MAGRDTSVTSPSVGGLGGEGGVWVNLDSLQARSYVYRLVLRLIGQSSPLIGHWWSLMNALRVGERRGSHGEEQLFTIVYSGLFSLTRMALCCLVIYDIAK